MVGKRCVLENNYCALASRWPLLCSNLTAYLINLSLAPADPVALEGESWRGYQAKGEEFLKDEQGMIENRIVFIESAYTLYSTLRSVDSTHESLI